VHLNCREDHLSDISIDDKILKLILGGVGCENMNSIGQVNSDGGL